MKAVKLFFVAIIAVAFASCASYHQTAPILKMQRNSVRASVEANLDLKNAKKVSATIEQTTILGIFNTVRNGNKLLSNSNNNESALFGGEFTKAERQALYKAKEQAGVDVILMPEFTTEKHSYFFGLYKTSKVKLNGWGTNITGLQRAE